MNTEDKLRLVMMDDRNRQLEVQNRNLMFQNIMNGPAIAGNDIEDDFQTVTVGLDEEGVEAYRYDIEHGRAVLITYIGNDWYPGVQYDIRVDGENIMGIIEREIAPTENPLEIQYLAEDEIVWYVSNLSSEGATEERDLGVVMGGKDIPIEVYDAYVDTLNQYETFTTDDDLNEIVIE